MSLGIAVGWEGSVYVTNDGGTNWVSHSTGIFADLSAVTYASPTTWFATSMGGNILKSTNAGVNWDVDTLGMWGFYDVCFLSTTLGYVCGGEGSIYKTTNGGATWQYQSSTVMQDMYAIDFTNSNIGVAAGVNGVIIRTTNGGVTPCFLDVTINFTSAGNTVNFYASPNGSITDSWWEFGDGQFSNMMSSPHTYTNSGFYHVKVTVRDSFMGCIASDDTTISVGTANNDCHAKFHFMPYGGTNEMSFSSQALGTGINYYFWNFGDGDTSYEPYPTHVFPASDYYNVCHTVGNVSGVYNTQCEMVRVGDDSTLCYADFTYFADSTGAKASGYPVDFKGATYGEPARVIWNFGDGVIDSTSLQPIHTYSSKGLYLTQLITYSSSGKKQVSLDLINVFSGETTLQGKFIFERKTGGGKAGGYPVDFKGATFGEPARIIWNFGDGKSDSTTLTPLHTYSNTGTYNVTLTVSDPLINQKDVYAATVVIPSAAINKYDDNPFNVSVQPNPFNNQAWIKFSLPYSSFVNIEICDLLGKPLENLSNEKRTPGEYRLYLNTELPSGLYLLKISTQNEVSARKILIYH